VGLGKRPAVGPARARPKQPFELGVYAPALAFPQGVSALKSMGFSKLVRRETGVYENVTAQDGQAKIVSADNPASGLNLGSTLGD